MPERLEKLRAAVLELERELRTLERIDPESRDLLEEAHREIQSALAGSKASPSESQNSLANKLENIAKRFEATHPTLAGVLERLVNGLAQLGI